MPDPVHESDPANVPQSPPTSPTPQSSSPTAQQPCAWPASTAQLRDGTLNPDDFSPVRGRFTPTGLDLDDPRCVTVLELSRSAADLLDERARLITEIRASTTTAVSRPPAGQPQPAPQSQPPSHQPQQPAPPYSQYPATPQFATPSPAYPQTAYTQPAPPQPIPQTPLQPTCPQTYPPHPQPTPSAASPQPPARARRFHVSTVQILLLALGVGLIALAVSVFAFITYPIFGDGARTACIAVTGLIGLAVSYCLAPKVRVTAEGVAWASCFALVTASVLAGGLGAIPLLRWRDLVTGLLLLVLAVIILGLYLASARRSAPIRAYSLTSCLLLPISLALISDTNLLSNTGRSVATIVCMTGILLLALLAPLPDAERLAATAISSFVLMVIGFGDFANPDHVRYAAITSLLAYLIPLAFATLLWIRIAAPAAPTTPIPNHQHALRDATRWVLTIVTMIMGIGMAGLSLVNDYRPLPPDLITGLFGVTALAVGVIWMVKRPTLRSWPALWPGLVMLLVPMLLVSRNDRGEWHTRYGVMWSIGQQSSSPDRAMIIRAVLLLLIALALVIAGALLGWQAPVIAGSITLIIHVMVQLWTWIVMFSMTFWWVWLAAGGILLVVVAARYERSINTARTLITRISQLR
ncbi:SCO7613 C-terminal domain-containing membrane protein [Bifidobacterium tissieri]|uniref:Uncharacterized protein n=1 Tax=Bifidobacterium tissieri TaxID=1630162 RepID=A0A5N0A077_9BIFI|nr:hypothetical protein [Bifidobacterium tissieri]KAA8831068.1 hypothetical protein EMO89_03195 [Bifidobacterium tissieri]KAA8833277.1 hypothetical protein EM849_00945 [Bifidobacterium tissieri]